MDIIGIYLEDLQIYKTHKDLLTNRLSNIDSIAYDFSDITFAVIQKNNDRKAWEISLKDLEKRIFDLQKKIDIVNNIENN